ncbi:MAG: DUF6525 family protein [Pseudomonadota bacterium]
MSNGYGSARVNREEDLAAYDELPAQMRQVIQNAVANWSAQFLHRKLHDLRHDGFLLCQAVQHIAGRIAREEIKDTLQFYGSQHPEAGIALAQDVEAFA